jgi:hypothetical protein
MPIDAAYSELASPVAPRSATRLRASFLGDARKSRAKLSIWVRAGGEISFEGRVDRIRHRLPDDVAGSAKTPHSRVKALLGKRGLPQSRYASRPSAPPTVSVQPVDATDRDDADGADRAVIYGCTRSFYVEQRINCGGGRYIEILRPNEFCDEASRVYYQFTGMKDGGIPPSFNVRGCGGYATRVWKSEDGDVVGIATDLSPDEIEILVDFKAGNSWPAD